MIISPLDTGYLSLTSTCLNRLALFRERLNHLFNQQVNDGLDSQTFDSVFMAINNGLSSREAFSLTETEAALVEMSNQNQIMYSDGVIYRI